MSDVLSTLIVALGGYSVVLLGLLAALWKIWLPRALAKDRLKTDQKLAEFESKLAGDNIRLEKLLDHSVHVDRVQFEHEFAIYRDIWASLIELRMATMRLRPILDAHDPKQTEEERKNERLIAFGAAFDAFRGLVEKNKPFYAAAVYQPLLNLLEKCFEESVEYRHMDMTGEAWHKAQQNRKEIVECIDVTCEAIRARIAQVRVVDG